MDTILFIAPHLSTGGLPQFLLKKIELLSKEVAKIYLVEYSDITGGKFIVQRSKLVEILSDRMFTLQEDKSKIRDIIKKIDPDVIHMEEIPEFFMEDEIADIIYHDTRNYKIIETSHDSSFGPKSKKYLPDKFLFVSEYQRKRYLCLDIPSEVVEYPIEYQLEKLSRDEACLKLGLDPIKKHVLHVGLFTPRKNQKEFFDYAASLHEYHFHSVGNQAENFEDYWKPLMESKPSNLTVWGERSDVDLFYMACDLHLFTSQGNPGDMETMPLVIRESISWDIPTLIYDLPVYESYFDSYKNISYLESSKEENINKIKSKLSPEIMREKKKYKTCLIIDAYISSKDKENLLFENLQSMKKFGHDIFLVSHSPVSEKIISEVDYFLYDKDNTFNDNHVYSWRKAEDIEIRVNINKSHEWPIIRSMRLAFNTAKSLGYEYFIFSEFDHEYSDSDIEKVNSIINGSIESNKKLIFWAPQEKVDYGGYGDDTGIFYETCFFSGDISFFLDIFNSKFPSTLEEYNSNFSSKFPNSLEFYFWKIFSEHSDYITIIPNYVKLDLKHSKINLSSYQNFKSLILKGEKYHYLYLTNDNSLEYSFKVYMDGSLYESFSLNSYFKLIKLRNDCNIKIEAYTDNYKFFEEEIEFKISDSNKYATNGQIIFNLGEKDIFSISFDPIDNKVHVNYNEIQSREVHVSIKDIDSKATIWSFDDIAENKSNWWCIPTPKNVLDYENQINFGGITVEIYELGKQIFSDSIRIKKPFVYKPEMDITHSEPIFSNYNEFFVDKIYSHLDLQSLGTVFDIGANAGLWTEFILKQNASRVFCFEPNKTALSILKCHHGQKNNVVIIDKAVDTEKKTIDFFYSDSNSLISATENHRELDKSYPVESITLLDVIASYSIDHIDLIKMDIEGAEFRVFDSFDDSIYDITDSFLVELHPFYYADGKQREEKIIQKLEDKGYHIEIHAGGIFATKYKKCFYVNNSCYAQHSYGQGTLEKVNLFDGAKEFSWDSLSHGKLTGYHHAYNEIFFSDGVPNKCIYEIENCEIESGDVVVDIGANIGIFSNYSYRKGASRIISFEPSTEAIQALLMNKTDKQEIFKLALSDSQDVESLSFRKGDTMSSSIENSMELSTEMVLSESLDSLRARGLFESIDFLKIDAEGSEYKIIKGASKMIESGLIDRISLEFHKNVLDKTLEKEMVSFMLNSGYSHANKQIGDHVSIYYFWKNKIK